MLRIDIRPQAPELARPAPGREPHVGSSHSHVPHGPDKGHQRWLAVGRSRYAARVDEDSSFYYGVLIGGDLPPHIGRGQERIQEQMTSHIHRVRGRGGPVWLAWWWALTGTVTSPITMQAPSGHPPSRAEILEEIDASPPGAISSETGEQIELARQVLAWLIGETEDLPV
jgi:hypothetical protein